MAPREPLTESSRNDCDDSEALGDARSLLAEHPAVDLHVDTLGHGSAQDILTSRSLHASPARLLAGGFGVAVYACWIPPHLAGPRGWDRWRAMTTTLASITTSFDTAARSPALVPALEDARILEHDRDGASSLARSGAAYVTLTWNTGNRFATSCEDTRTGAGLTDAGRTLVGALAEQHIRVDLSHLSDRAASEVLDLSPEAPIASHSSARALCPHPRNLSDLLARRIADRGGVIGVNVYPTFLSRHTRRVDVNAVADHVDHLRRVSGEESVAFGSDFDGISLVPRGLEGSDAFPALLATLASRGCRREFLVRFARTNALRVLATTPAFTRGTA
jgi:membrane dipeptidase